MEKTFKEIQSNLPILLDALLSASGYPIKDLTEGKNKKVFGESSIPVQGIFLLGLISPDLFLSMT